MGWGGQAANFSHFTYSSVLQNEIPGKYSQEVWSTFTHLAISYNIEAVTQERPANSTGTLITFTLVSSQSEGSTQGKTSQKGQGLPFPLDSHLVVHSERVRPYPSSKKWCSNLPRKWGSPQKHRGKSTVNNTKMYW